MNAHFTKKDYPMSALITALKLVPKNALSRTVGALLRAPLPPEVTKTVIRSFSKAYGVDVSEAEREVTEYPTFNDFFTRRLKEGARPFDADPTLAICPVDGTVGQVGTIERDTLVQAKGRLYTLGEFLVDVEDARRFEGGVFATLYLAPYNYHRIHTPLAGAISGWAYVPGHLWPVNAAGVADIDKLFAVNERLVSYVDTDYGRVAVAKIGATCVGRIRATYADVVTNDRMKREFTRVNFDDAIPVDKGGELGVFEMGSTVIVLFEKGRAALDPDIVTGKTIRLGMPLARME